MAVIYQDTFKCRKCERQPAPGFLYRCTVDRDPLILSATAKGDRVTFDSFGDDFAEEMTLGKFGPESRRKQHSFLNEVTPEQMSSYTLQQLALILEQRENVQKVIADQRKECYKTRKRYPDDTMPWVRREKYECQYMICHHCYSRAKEKSWVSLNGVLNGDILPSVATGFSFSYSGSRPCADVNVVRDIGCWAVPLPRNHPARAPSSLASTSSVDATPEVDQRDGPAEISSAEGCSVFHLPLDGRATQPENTTSGHAAAPRSMPTFGAEISIQDFIFEYDYSEYTLACCTPLPAADMDEDRFLSSPRLTAGGTEGGEGHSAAEPVDGVDGIALTKEAAESCIADIVVHTAPAPSRMEASA